MDLPSSINQEKKDAEAFDTLIKKCVRQPCACFACHHIEEHNLVAYINRDDKRRIDLLMSAAAARNLPLLKVLLASDPRVKSNPHVGKKRNKTIVEHCTLLNIVEQKFNRDIIFKSRINFQVVRKSVVS